MKFKYNLIAMSLLGTMMVSCDPLGDIYQEIDAQGSDVTKSKEEYVLTKADYESIAKAALADAGEDETNKALANKVKTDLALNSFATADKYVPAILKSLYPSWGEGSTVGVTYNFQEEISEEVKQFANVAIYELTDDDYAKVWGEEETMSFLSPKHAPETVLPEVLKASMSDASAGSFVAVDYKYDEKDPEYVQGQDLFSEDFNSLENDAYVDALPGWKDLIVEGTKGWQANVYKEDGCFELSAYKAGGKLDRCLVTPAVAITNADAGFTFDLAMGYYKGDCLSVYVSDSYDGGDVFSEANWTEITSSLNFPEGNSGGYTDEANVGTYSLAAYNGKTVYFAFRYRGEDGVATTTIQIDNVKVTTSRMSETNEKPYNALYQFDGAQWKAYKGSEAILVAPADYDAMGTPGSHDNFSSSDKPENYLPQFLAGKYPYAQQGDSKVVLYKYYDSTNKTTTMIGDEYKYDTAWTLNKNIVTKSKETYIVVSGQWIFSPIVNVSMTKDDYQILVDWVAENHPGYIDAKYKDSEYWFGASVNYSNFNVSLPKRRSNDPDGVLTDKSDEEAEVYLANMVAEGAKKLLELKYPNADAQMNGADVHYVVSTTVYDGGYFVYTFKFKSLGGGQFEQAGEPEISSK